MNYYKFLFKIIFFTFLSNNWDIWLYGSGLAANNPDLCYRSVFRHTHTSCHRNPSRFVVNKPLLSIESLTTKEVYDHP